MNLNILGYSLDIYHLNQRIYREKYIRLQGYLLQLIRKLT